MSITCPITVTITASSGNHPAADGSTPTYIGSPQGYTEACWTPFGWRVFLWRWLADLGQYQFMIIDSKGGGADGNYSNAPASDLTLGVC